MATLYHQDMFATLFPGIAGCKYAELAITMQLVPTCTT